MPTTILLVDDHPVFRKGLRVLLEEEQDIQVVGEAGDGQEAIDQVRKLSPDVVIMDITMPNFNGIDATRHIISEFPDTKIIALSIHSGKRFIEDMLRAGAVGYILKESAPEELLNGVRAVMRDEIYLSSSVTGIVISEFVKVGTGFQVSGDYDEWMAEETIPIIRTKFHRPPIPETHVRRPRLLEQLEKGRHRQLTLVSAPAGYGKSLLLSSWLENCDCHNAWYSVDESDNNLRQFLIYFLTAIRTMLPNAVEKTLALANSENLSPLRVLVASLLNEMNLIDQGYILVIDDIHLIQEKLVHDLLTELLRYPPPLMHLVLSGRRDPFLPISSFRARGLLTEIRLQDLCFTTAETTAYLQQMLGEQIEDAIAAKWTEKTEGWIVGLHLAALSMRQRGDAASMLSELPGGVQYVTEYLFNEVFVHQAPGVRHYLLSTSILDRFCAPLCDVLCGPDVDSRQADISSWDFLNFLKKENLFIINLDAENRWFRYHHLFQKLLFNQLNRQYSAEEIKALHVRAGAWFAENVMLEEALQHYMAAGDIPAAMQLVALHGHNMMNDQQWPTLERCLGMLPRDCVEQDPELLLLEAWFNHVRTNGIDVLAMATYLEKVEALFYNLPAKASTSAMQMKGHFDALRGFQLFMSADGESALKHTLSACENIPIHHKRARVFAHIFQTGAYQMVGDLETGLSIYNNEIQRSIDLGSSYHAMYLADLCYIYWIDADLNAMRQTAEHSLKIAMDRQMPETTAFSLYFLGIACYHQNNLKIAEEKLAVMVEAFYFYNPVNFAHSSFALALIYQAKGKIGKARKVCDEVVNYAIDCNNQVVLLFSRAFEAELALRQGRLAEASHWARQFHAKPFLPPYCFYMPQLTLIKILMAQDMTDSQQQAKDLLDQLYDFCVSIHNECFRLHVLALQALCNDTRGEKSAALEKLTQALELGEPGGFIRLFVDLGPQMVDLLKQLIKQNVAVGYIGRIMAAFRDDAHRAVPVANDHESQSPRFPIPLSPSPSPSPPLSPSPSFSISQPLVEPLTNRELDVLELLAQRLQTKEIAEKLFISTETVKSHLNNIYGKLNVSNRRHAVEKAKTLGIL